MARGRTTKRGIPWRSIILLTALVILGGLAWWNSRPTAESSEKVEVRVACAHCGYSGRVSVAASTRTADWPMLCPKCHDRHLYPARPCPVCGKLIPLKDPASDQVGGWPKTCPWCKASTFEP